MRLGSVWANPASQTNRVHTVLITGCRRVGDAAPEASEAFDVEEVDAAAVLADVREGRMDHPYMVAAVLHLQLHRPELLR